MCAPTQNGTLAMAGLRTAFSVKISKDGYETAEAAIQSQGSGSGCAAMAGNILLVEMIGAATDVGTGATNEAQASLHVELVKAQNNAPAAGRFTRHGRSAVQIVLDLIQRPGTDPALGDGRVDRTVRLDIDQGVETMVDAMRVPGTALH